MNVVGFAAGGLPASGSCVFTQHSSNTVRPGGAWPPRFGLVGNTAHSSYSWTSPIKYRYLLWDSHRCTAAAAAAATMAESQDEARQRSASGHTIHRNTGRPRTVNIALLLLGQDINIVPKCPQILSAGIMQWAPSYFIHHIKMKLQQLKLMKRLKQLKRPQWLRFLDRFSQNKSAISKTSKKNYNCDFGVKRISQNSCAKAKSGNKKNSSSKKIVSVIHTALHANCSTDLS